MRAGTRDSGPVVAQSPSVDAGLRCDGIRVAYGGNIAVNDVSLVAPRRQITGLIGPNGAGKTTFFNACSGLLRPVSGSLHLFDLDVSGWGVAARARLGLGRTFQRVEVCNAMTVQQNVGLGLEARLVGRNGFYQFVAPKRQRQAIARAADEAMEICGIGHIANRSVSTLPIGHRRLLELARVLAGGAQFLLLDEPSSGLDDEETEAMGRVITDVVRERGVGVLLVEHDMALVMRICAQIYVLDFGTLIFQGTTTAVQESDLVRAAYLGEESVEANR